MKELLRWFYTDPNGNEYMTLVHCALDDSVWISLVTSSLMIVVVYALIGRHALITSKRYPDSLAKKYLVQKTYVFVYCAVAGYLMLAISAWINPYKLRVIINLILAFWATRFYLSMRKTDVLDKIYRNELKIMAIQDEITKKLWQSDSLEKIGSDVIWGVGLGVWVVLDGIRFKVVERTEKKAIVMTECDPDSTFGLHCHPDLYESVEVLEGHLIDPYNSKYASKGEVIEYEKGEPHEPGAKIFSIYKVTFTK